MWSSTFEFTAPGKPSPFVRMTEKQRRFMASKDGWRALPSVARYLAFKEREARRFASEGGMHRGPAPGQAVAS